MRSKAYRICACSDKEVLESYFLKHVRDTIRQTKEGRVVVSLPWKESFPKCLQFNGDTALAKLASLKKRLNKSGLTECYSEEMKLILDEYAEPVPNCFRYVKSSLNPADVLTKQVEKFKLSSWHEGPQFLTQAKENWLCFLPTKNIALSTKEEKRILALNSCATNIDDFEDHLLKPQAPGRN